MSQSTINFVKKLSTKINSVQPCCSIVCQILSSLAFSYERRNTHTTATTENILTIIGCVYRKIFLTFQSWILQNSCQKRVKQDLMKNDIVTYEIRRNYNSNKIIS